MSGDTFRCVDCGRTFDLSYDEQRFFKERGLDLPKRCKTCRSRRRRERDSGMRPEVGPQATPKPSPSAQQKWAQASRTILPPTARGIERESPAPPPQPDRQVHSSPSIFERLRAFLKRILS
jgi:hypothetical protein